MTQLSSKPMTPFHKQAISEWNRVLRDLFPVALPDTSRWDDLESIVHVLSTVGVQNVNHTFLPMGGGLDLTGSCPSAEHDCIELKFDLGTHIVKPGSLTCEIFRNHAEWSYFRLETEGLDPSGVYPNLTSEYEELTEVSPRQYDDRCCFDSGCDSRGQSLPDEARTVVRVFHGVYVVFCKASPYNLDKSLNAYSAIHAQMTAAAFRQHIAQLAGV